MCAEPPDQVAFIPIGIVEHDVALAQWTSACTKVVANTDGDMRKRPRKSAVRPHHQFPIDLKTVQSQVRR